MKAIPKTILFFSVIFISLFFSFSCKKDKEMTATVTVKMQSDTNIVVPLASVQIGTKGDIRVSGVTNALGQFSYSYKDEAIFDIVASKQVDSVTIIHGSSIIRLVPGKTVYKSVFVN